MVNVDAALDVEAEMGDGVEALAEEPVVGLLLPLTVHGDLGCRVEPAERRLRLPVPQQTLAPHRLALKRGAGVQVTEGEGKEGADGAETDEAVEPVGDGLSGQDARVVEDDDEGGEEGAHHDDGPLQLHEAPCTQPSLTSPPPQLKTQQR